MTGAAGRWLRDQLFFLVVLAALIAAFLYLLVEPDHWARGTAGVATAVIAAGLMRLVLPSRRVGLLAVRGRWVDSVYYLVLGAVILAVDLRLHA